MVIIPSKCIFDASFLNFLGYHVSPTSITPLQTGVQAIQDFLPPTSACKLSEFLGLVNFCCHFLPLCAQLLCPLTDLLSANNTSGSFNLNDAALAVFQAIKGVLANASVLTHLSSSGPYGLMVDASTVAVGGVL